ncbi:D-methionine transport system permease protein [Arcanobacterium pluranimalium]|uniref:methionine ABC transporter permease n=1 Tax=Arcanobacterium pluranimalium TaxID=108028 RepID=UPI00195B631B|nr:ABC transporter permease subunit [Arcanobacterium pluranimalium]MBM7825251.1 D-methionine transport system permease protein [Arcanobacterium pluranimalium]
MSGIFHVTPAFIIGSQPLLAADNSWFNNPAIKQMLLPATIESLLMIFVATFFTVVIGLPLGVILAESRKGGVIQNVVVNKLLGTVINLGRAIPFIILAIVVLFAIRALHLPWLTAIGWQAFTIALVVSAIPYFARMVESNVLAVESGKVEAAQMMGASRFTVMWGVLVRESLPSIIQSITILTITIIGYSAMASAVGGGGLGALAINYGYQRYQFDVIVIVVVVILVLVQIIQMIGDMLSRLVDHR